MRCAKPAVEERRGGDADEPVDPVRLDPVALERAARDLVDHLDDPHERGHRSDEDKRAMAVAAPRCDLLAHHASQGRARS